MQAQDPDILTEFTLDDNNATVEVMSVNLSNLGINNFRDIFVDGDPFTTGPTAFDFTTQFFTPSVSGSYVFGQTASPVDTVLLVYEGSFDPLQPGDGLASYNDDHGNQIGEVSSFGSATGSTLGDLPVTIVSCHSTNTLPARCPIVEMELVAGQRYQVVVSTFSSGTDLTLPQDFFVYGPGTVLVGAPSAIPLNNPWALSLLALLVLSLGLAYSRRATSAV
ncbi:hypothetical protein [Kineobactrum salinum]|uniref:IPTL-CTERM sorting domain-containing protein n=1 Tax=Kineobactrum salinum TaxID=2708301 RepID=A0A6C0U1H6_9GAMM|nr:hypothetical protein [Kineobactrum salinum]QIB65866.1 hypothetical protein G3T16_10995 [Kineobactrum salinum]